MVACVDVPEWVDLALGIVGSYEQTRQSVHGAYD